MLQIDNGNVVGYTITGNIGAELYAGLLPLQDESGAAWWVIDHDNGMPFVDSDGQTYTIRQRTLADIQATPEYDAWARRQPSDPRYPTAYLRLTLTGGDGLTPIGCHLNGENPIRIAARLEDAAGALIDYDWEGRILMYDGDGRPLDCLRCSLAQGEAALTFAPQAGAVPHYLTSQDFDRIDVAEGVTAQVKIIDEPLQIRVYR